MTSDLVKWVRAWDPVADGQPVYPDEIMHAAADHIKALRAAIRAKLEAEAAFRAAAKFGGPFDGLAAADDAATARLRELLGDGDD